MVNTVSRVGFNIGIKLRISLLLCLYETLIKLPCYIWGNLIGPLMPALYKYILTFPSLSEIDVVLFTFKVRTNEVRATYLI